MAKPTAGLILVYGQASLRVPLPIRRFRAAYDIMQDKEIYGWWHLILLIRFDRFWRRGLMSPIAFHWSPPYAR